MWVAPIRLPFRSAIELISLFDFRAYMTPPYPPVSFPSALMRCVAIGLNPYAASIHTISTGIVSVLVIKEILNKLLRFQ